MPSMMSSGERSITSRMPVMPRSAVAARAQCGGGGADRSTGSQLQAPSSGAMLRKCAGARWRRRVCCAPRCPGAIYTPLRRRAARNHAAVLGIARDAGCRYAPASVSVLPADDLSAFAFAMSSRTRFSTDPTSAAAASLEEQARQLTEAVSVFNLSDNMQTTHS